MRLHRHSHSLFWFVSCLWLVVLLAACSLSPAQTTKQPKPTPKGGNVSQCQPPSPITTSAIGLPEVRGTANGQTSLWALLFSPLVAHQQVKIVWRMTGDGNLQIVARGPNGRSVKPDWITPHNSSNWNRPGYEWGTGFTLPTPGCWDFHATRGTAFGDIWLIVR